MMDAYHTWLRQTYRKVPAPSATLRVGGSDGKRFGPIKGILGKSMDNGHK